jgi:multicomponent Na+:H+ antiporter subunit D
VAEVSLLVHPVLPLLVGAVLVRITSRRVGHVIMVGAPSIALLLVTRLGPDAGIVATYLGHELQLLRVDALSRPFGIIFAIAGLIAGIYGLRTMQAAERSAALVYAGAAMGVVFAGDLITFFVFWEVKAIASTFVILARRTPGSGRAGLRYVFIHVLGGKLLLAGILLHLSQTGSLAFGAFEPGIASTLILAACLISAAVPPLHAWLADAYPQGTVAGTVFLSAYTTKAAVYALARGFAGFEVLVWLGIFMALYGVVYAVLENDIRRLLGYHIISQVGYMVAGVGIGTQAAINGATAHAFAHILYKGLLLMGAGAVIHATGRSKMSELGGIANRMRPVLALYLVGAVSISSFPLFSGFVSKEIVVEAAALDGRALAVILLQVASVGTFLHTGLKLPYGAWVGREGLGPRSNTGARLAVGPIPASMYVAMGISAALNLAIGVVPSVLHGLLPYPADYDFYTVGKVLEKSQILLFTGLGFWLLLSKLHATAMVTVDTDWLYRQLPRRVGEVGERWRDRRAPIDHEVPPLSAPDRALQRTRTAVLERVAGASAQGTPPVAATWTLGAVILATSLVLLVVSLVP